MEAFKRRRVTERVCLQAFNASLVHFYEPCEGGQEFAGIEFQ